MCFQNTSKHGGSVELFKHISHFVGILPVTQASTKILKLPDCVCFIQNPEQKNISINSKGVW